MAYFRIAFISAISIFMLMIACERKSELETLLDKGHKLSRNNEFAEAERVYKRYISLTRKIAGSENLHETTGLIALSMLYTKQHKFEMAEYCARSAIDIFNKHERLNEWDGLIALSTLGNVYLAQEKWNDAESLYLSILETNDCTDFEDTLTYLNNTWSLAVIYWRTGETNKAESLWNEYIKCYNESRANQPIFLSYFVKSYQGLGIIYTESGQYSEADSALKKAISIINANRLDRSTSKAGCLLDLSYLYEKINLLDSSEISYDKAIELLEDYYGGDSSGLYDVYGYLGYFYHKRGRFDRSREYKEKAQSIKSVSDQDTLCSASP
jgi:tetratricopeptide (TPR) repeat protein